MQDQIVGLQISLTQKEDGSCAENIGSDIDVLF